MSTPPPPSFQHILLAPSGVTADPAGLGPPRPRPRLHLRLHLRLKSGLRPFHFTDEYASHRHSILMRGTAG